ncbi:hypothetical protein MP638_006987, partial [Amoeboaphelidium occidentale]
MERKKSILNLPPEMLRMISIYLELDDLGQFQTASPNILAATSDIPKKAIRKIRLYRDRISNWKGVLMRLHKDALEFAHYFYQNELNKGIDEILYEEAI